MPTVVTLTVKPSGGNYTSLNTALAAIPSNIVTTDEQYDVVCDTFSGGLAEQVTVPTITQDATRYVHIKADTGHEYNPVDDSGFFLTASVGFSATVVNSQNFTRFSNIGAKNTRTATNGRGFDNFGTDNVITGVYSTTASTSGAIVFFLNNATNLDISYCLAVNGTTGFDFGNNFTRTADHLTSVDASAVGFDTGTADTTITNSLTIGSTDPYLGTFNASSDYNAGDSTDAPGSNSLDNRTTADFADYAGGDYRTASGSALANAGSGGTYIGYALEASAGITVSAESQDYNVTFYDASIDLTGEISVSAESQQFNVTFYDAAIDFTGEVLINAESQAYNVTFFDAQVSLISGIEVQAQTQSYDVTFFDASVSLFGEINVSAESQSYAVTFYDATVAISELWTDKPKAVTNWVDQARSATIWTDK